MGAPRKGDGSRIALSIDGPLDWRKHFKKIPLAVDLVKSSCTI